MAGLTRATRIGIIAEEKNDVEVIYELTCKIMKEENFAVSSFVGHGCGKLRRKCRAWAENLLRRGCSQIVVVHDLDRCDEKQLRTTLEQQLEGLESKQTVVLIPIEELEARLLSDAQALKTVFNMRRSPTIPHWPEKIVSPKEFLASIVKQNSNSLYLNTIHNRSIAKKLSISNLDRCPSFSPYPKFLGADFSTAAPRVQSASRKRRARRS
jgi:hypothetical protein